MKKAYMKPEAKHISFEVKEALMDVGASNGDFGWEEDDE